MNTPLTMTQPNGPEALVQGLLGTLDDESEALEELTHLFQRQLEVVRSSPEPVGEELVEAVSNVVGRLGRLRAGRERQTRLLCRVLKLEMEAPALAELAEALSGHATLSAYGEAVRDARTEVRHEARQARRAGEALNFALQYAEELGRELMQVAHGQKAPAGPQTYTATGRPSRPASRSMMNHVG